jgi:hypothetical protein
MTPLKLLHWAACAVLLAVPVALPAIASDKATIPSAMFRPEIREFRDSIGRLMGRTLSRPDGDVEGRTNTGRYVGRYSPAKDTTFDLQGRLVGRGNHLSSIIIEDYRRVEAQKKAAAPGGLMADPDAPVIGSLTDMGPEAEARRQAMKAHITDSDRIVARQALNKAGLSPFTLIEWRNPETGHHGSWLLREVDLRTSRWMHGAWIECRFATMTLQVRQYIDTQQQTVCPVPGIGWATAVVNGDR